jgi:DNA-directed RNA polymerase subunit M/transcription elongation factor TFIIS
MYKIQNPESFRDRVREKFTPIIGDDTKSTNLEKGIYNFAIKEANLRKIIKKWENPFFAQLYVDRLRAIMINLKNEDLVKQLQSGDITPQGLAFMTHQEMNPEHWAGMMEQKMKRDANRFNTNVQASTDMFTCKRCKSKRSSFFELQTRSADEPATIFVTCLDCGKTSKH